MTSKEDARRDVEEGEDKPSSTVLLNDTEISAVAEELASLALATKDSDANSDLDDELGDPELWKPHPPTEDCPVCFVPLPIDTNSTCVKRIYYACCGKTVCSACSEEHDRALRISNAKREEKDLPELKESCPFCRASPFSDNSELIDHLESLVLKGDAHAATSLADKFMHGEGITQDVVKAMELFHFAADKGSGYGNFVLGTANAYGMHGVAVDLEKARMFAERAVKVDFIPARKILALLEAKEGNAVLAFRHYRLGAEAGCKGHMDTLWKWFYQGKISKDILENTLRKYHQACDNMDSEERERYSAWMKAKEENKGIEYGIYNGYYQGVLNAKQLKICLANLRSGRIIPIKMN